MSRRYVSREEYAAATAAATDPGRIITHFLSQMRAHVATDLDDAFPTLGQVDAALPWR